jgi:hypothetical protein
MPAAALKGYGNKYPQMSGYIDNYLASKGCKPWQMRQMQTIFRSLVVPPALVKYMMDYYSVKQHPRIENLHHYMPIPVWNATEAGGSQTGLWQYFSELFTTMKAAITDYEEFLALMKLGGYPLVEMPDIIECDTSAKAYELQVNSAPFYEAKAGTDDVYAAPQAGYKHRLVTLQRYVSDLGPSFARGLTPAYVADASNVYSATNYVFDSAVGNVLLASMGYQRFGRTGLTNHVPRAEPGFLNFFGGGEAYQTPSPAYAASADTIDALALLASDNARIVKFGSTNETYWRNWNGGFQAPAGSLRATVSDTLDPNTLDAAAGTSNLGNAKQVYDALLRPA